LLELLTKEYYTKSRFAKLAIAVGLIMTFAGLLLLIQNVFATTIVQNQGLTSSTILTLRAICIENSGTWNDYYCGFTNIQSKQNFEQRVIGKGLADEYQFLSTPTMGFAAPNVGGRETIIIKEDNDDDDYDNDGIDKDDVRDLLKKQCKKDGKVWYRGACVTEDEKADRQDALCDNEDAKTTKIDECKAKEEDGKPVPVNNLTPQVKVSASANKDLREDKEVKEVCDEVGGQMEADGCHTDHDGPMADEFERKMTEKQQKKFNPEVMADTGVSNELEEKDEQETKDWYPKEKYESVNKEYTENEQEKLQEMIEEEESIVDDEVNEEIKEIVEEGDQDQQVQQSPIQTKDDEDEGGMLDNVEEIEEDSNDEAEEEQEELEDGDSTEPEEDEEEDEDEEEEESEDSEEE
jgi:hypothetical protein